LERIVESFLVGPAALSGRRAARYGTENAAGWLGIPQRPLLRNLSGGGAGGGSRFEPGCPRYSREAAIGSRPRYSKSMLSSVAISSDSRSSPESTGRLPTAHPGTAARDFRTRAAEALGSVPSSERVASKSRGRPQISARARPTAG